LIIIDFSNLRNKYTKQFEIPALEGFSITEVIDSSFNKRKIQMLENGKVLIEGDDLDSLNSCIVKLEGKLEDNILKKIVSMTISLPHQNGEKIRYWISYRIQDLSYLNEIYKYEVEVKNIIGIVRIKFENFLKDIGNEIPDIMELQRIRENLMDSMFMRNRNLQFQYKRSLIEKEKKLNNLKFTEIKEIINRLTSYTNFINFLQIEGFYSIIEITKREGSYTLPAEIEVKISTDLSLNMPIMEGELIFKYSEFIKKVKEHIQQYMENHSANLHLTRKIKRYSTENNIGIYYKNIQNYNYSNILTVMKEQFMNGIEEIDPYVIENLEIAFAYAKSKTKNVLRKFKLEDMQNNLSSMSNILNKSLITEEDRQLAEILVKEIISKLESSIISNSFLQSLGTNEEEMTGSFVQNVKDDRIELSWKDH
jgi:Holliday junction resolvase RusA-like endonuclease